MEEKFMRILVMFDMPTTTKEERKSSASFRKFLIKNGFFMLQFSVYIRICKGLKSVDTHLKNLENAIPNKGHIRALVITEKQFDHMKLLLGKKTETEKVQTTAQLTLF